MSSSLLQTKLYIPPARPRLVSRPRLFTRLTEGLASRVTLISAPAGFGKTTLVSEWIKELRNRKYEIRETSKKNPAVDRPSSFVFRVSWLSLGEEDSDPDRFLKYFIAALQQIEADVGAKALNLLHAPQPPPIKSTLTTLLNEMTTVSDDFVIVLDDYHLVKAKAVDDILTFLLNHSLPQMHLIINSRSDPDLPLARLRGRGELSELRAADLRFTPTEAAEFLNRAMGLDLAPEEIAALETRIEGWIAGLQLVALSLQGRTNTADFIEAFTGSHRFVLDYLVEEVLEHQPEPVHRFLLQTAILKRLCGALCDAVTGQQNGKEMLATLERSNLFIVPLDDERQWYRYHHLLADVLHARLMEEEPHLAADLHQRASKWYEQHDLPADAIRHAFEAEDFERAASLVQRAWPMMRQRYPDAALVHWVKALPGDVLRGRPILNVYYATASIPGKPGTAETHLRDAERWLETNGQAEANAAQSAVLNKEELRSLPGMIAFARAYQAGALGNRADTVKYAQQALDLLPENEYLYRGSAAVLLAFAHWSSGELESAHRSIVDGLSSMQKSGDSSAAISALYIQADIRRAQGHLRQAHRIGQQALKVAADHGQPVPQGTADVYTVLSELHHERNKLDIAAQHLVKGQDLGEHAALQAARHRWYMSMARIKEAQGDLEGALDLLDEAQRVYFENPAPDVRPIPAIKARLWVKQGRLSDALAWVREANLSTADVLSYLREFEHITLARVLISRYRTDQAKQAIHDAAGLLERLGQVAKSGGRLRSVIEILILQALVHQAQGDIPAALKPLQQALKLAEPEGFVRLFVDEGVSMAHLLHEAISQQISPEYARRLLDDLPALPSEQIIQSKAQPPLIDPLSKRELEILHHIAQGLTNQDIADQLYLSLYTVKAHARNIYGKLGVSNRTQAVTRSRELGILPD